MNFKKNIFSKLINYCFYLLFFLTPLVFSPVNYELFEFPKMMLVYGLTIIIGCLWLAKAVSLGKLEIRRTPLDLALVLYLLSSLLSTIFSLHPYTSLWGYYSRSHGGLLSISAYIFLYYAFLANQESSSKNRRSNNYNYIYILLFSAFLAALYGVLEKLGIDDQYWIQDVKNRVFSTLGQPNWLAAFLCALIFIPLSIIKDKNNNKNSLCFLFFIVYYFCLIFTNSKSGLLAFWLSFILFIVLNFKKIKQNKEKNIFLFSLILIIYFIFGAKTYSYLTKTKQWIKTFTSGQPVLLEQTISRPEKPFISESSQIRKTVWQGAFEIFKHYPFFGSGLETFGYVFYNFKPQAHNLLSEWDFLYNKAHNEFLNILACQGLIGTTSYLLIIIFFCRWFFNRYRRGSITFLQTAFFCGWISILITNFFGFSVVITGLLFFFLPAFSFIPAEKQDFLSLKVSGFNKKIIKKIGWLIIFIFGLYLLSNLWRRFKADVYFSQGEKYYQSNQLLSGLEKFQQAVELNPDEALYQAYSAKTAAKLAAVYRQIEADDSTEISLRLGQLAVWQIENALKLNPIHLNFYKNKAEVYLLLADLEPESEKKAINALNSAAELAPTDAKILYNLGLLYQQSKQYNQAIEKLEQAIKLKSNYLEAYLQLAEVLIETEQKEKAEKTLNFIINRLDPKNEAAKKLLEELNQ